MALLFEHHPQDSRERGPVDVCPCLPANMGMGGGNIPLLVVEDGELFPASRDEVACGGPRGGGADGERPGPQGPDVKRIIGPGGGGQ